MDRWLWLISSNPFSVNSEFSFLIDCPIAESWYERFTAIDLLLASLG